MGSIREGEGAEEGERIHWRIRLSCGVRVGDLREGMVVVIVIMDDWRKIDSKG